jgi:amino acid transporter
MNDPAPVTANRAPGESAKPRLARVMGRWTLTALVVNGIIGGGIFSLPSKIHQAIGPAALWGYLIAGVCMAAMVAVMAELSSQFREAGGPYLYARTALGRFAGIQAGWFLWLMRISAAAAVSNVFVDSLVEFWPAAKDPIPRAGVLIALIGGLAAVNYRGARAGARTSNTVTIAKLVTLGLFVIGGLVLVRGQAAPATVTTPSLSDWGTALLALVYAYGGFEAVLIPAGEAEDPRRHMPFALLCGLAVIAVLYISIHYVAMTALPNLAESKRPLADAARTFAGEPGAAVVALGALLAAAGWVAVQVLSAPRLTYALAENGDFPRIFARVHPRFLTPHISIVVWAVLALALAIWADFRWNAFLSVAARLVTYLTAGLAMLRLRQIAPTAEAWRAPCGRFLAVFGIGFCLLLMSSLELWHATILAVVAAVASVNWWIARAQKPAEIPRA